MKFEILGIVFIAIILIFTIIGLARGFFATLVSFIKSILSFVVAVLVSKPIASLLMDINLSIKWSDSLTNKFVSKGGVWIEPYDSATSNIVLFDKIKLPESTKDLFDKILGKCSVMAGEGATLAQVVGLAIVYYAWIVIAFILAFIIVSIICSLLKKLFKSIEDKIKPIKVINKLLGAALGFVSGSLLVFLIAYGISFLVPMENSVSEWLIEDMQLNSDTPTIAKFFYNSNVVTYLASLIQKLF